MRPHLALPVALLLGLSLACAGAPPEEPAAVAPLEVSTTLPDDLPGRYTAFRDAGCPVERLSSPAATRALRNLPYAVAGRRFQSADLSSAFAGDGGWYAPSDSEPTLEEADAACTEALREREDQLRTVHCVDAESQAVLTTDPAVLAWHLDTDVSGLFGEPTDPTPSQGNPYDPCHPPEWKPGDPATSFDRWVVRVHRGVDAVTARSYLVDGSMPVSRVFLDDLLAAQGRRLASLGDEPLTCLTVRVDGEDRHPEEHFPWAAAQACCGTGDFMGEDWVCTTGSAP